MKQHLRVILSVAASFGLVAILLQNYRHQRETDRHIAEIQQTLYGTTTAHASNAREGMVPVVRDGQTVGSDAARKQHDVEEILSVGWKLVDQHAPDQGAKAVQVFTDGLVHVDPSNPDLHNGLGRALLIAGNPRGAIAAWRNGLVLAPQVSDMQSGIGWAYWRLNDPYRAKEAWQKALNMNPQSLDAWSAMAWIDLALGKSSDAKRGFQELVRFDSRRDSWVMGLSMARAGNTSVRAIAPFFPLPPLELFDRPLPMDPAAAPASAASRP